MPPYLAYCSIEVANMARVASYIANGLADARGHWWANPGRLPAVLWREAGTVSFTSPTLDAAPWYDPLVVESGDFCGFYIDQPLAGLDTTETRTSTPTSAYRGGSILDAATLSEREIVAHGYLVSSTEAGVEYGRRWLADVLGASPSPCADCDLTLRISAPPDDGTNDAQGLWKLYRVALRHLEVKDVYQCPEIREVTLTLVAGDPVLYRDPVDCVIHQVLSPSFADATCIPFDQWYCGDPLDSPICCIVSPQRIGRVAGIITLAVEGGVFSGARLTISQSCPGLPGVSADAEALIGPLPTGSSIVIDAARHQVVYTDPNGAAWDGVPYLELPPGMSVPWIEIAPSGADSCVCVEPLAPCAGGGETFVTITTQSWER